MDALPSIYVYGLPLRVGGANTELWHTLRLWRSIGLAVSILPRPTRDADAEARIESIGCRLVESIPDGAIVIGFCNSALRADATALRARGCRLVCVPCMCFLWPDERNTLLADVYVFQSKFQRDALMMRYRVLGLAEHHAPIIRGAFCMDDFLCAPRPHTAGKPFIIGRLSRAARDKYPHDLWRQYEAIPYRPLRARVMGWSAEIEAHCGPPPDWAEVLPPNAETPNQFLASLHCLAPGCGSTPENWPRVGLEAMAAGVPVVAERLGGWIEMQPAALVRTPREQAYRIAHFAYNPDARLRAAMEQRRLVAQHADPARIADQWLALFRSLA